MPLERSVLVLKVFQHIKSEISDKGMELIDEEQWTDYCLVNEEVPCHRKTEYLN